MADLRRLVDRARMGDVAVLPELRRLLDGNPGIWRLAGDLAGHARAAWVGLVAGPDLLVRESVGRRLEALEAELAGPVASPLERLLAARVAVAWLQVHHADLAAAAAGCGPDRRAEQAALRQARAHRGYLQAAAALASVRRLLPVVGASEPATPRLGLHPGGRTDSRRPDGDGVATTDPLIPPCDRRADRRSRIAGGQGP